jgi:hypothetical protein
MIRKRIKSKTIGCGFNVIGNSTLDLDLDLDFILVDYVIILDYNLIIEIK